MFNKLNDLDRMLATKRSPPATSKTPQSAVSSIDPAPPPQAQVQTPSPEGQSVGPYGMDVRSEQDEWYAGHEYDAEEAKEALLRPNWVWMDVPMKPGPIDAKRGTPTLIDESQFVRQHLSAEAAHVRAWANNEGMVKGLSVPFVMRHVVDGDLDLTRDLFVEHPRAVDFIPEVGPCGWTSLHMAAFFGHADLVDLLIKMEDKVEFQMLQTQSGHTAMQIALWFGRHACAKHLAAACKNVDTRGNTALHAAQEFGGPAVAFLLERGVDPMQKNKCGHTVNLVTFLAAPSSLAFTMPPSSGSYAPDLNPYFILILIQ